MRCIMEIWRLKPIVLNSISWQASTYCGEVIVRAEGESQARQFATREFGIATKVKLAQSIRANPWKDPKIVSCELFDNPDYDRNGPATMFLPKR